MTGTPLSGADALRWQRYQVMKAMHWTREEYDHAPASQVREIVAFMATEIAYYNSKREQNG